MFSRIETMRRRCSSRTVSFTLIVWLAKKIWHIQVCTFDRVNTWNIITWSRNSHVTNIFEGHFWLTNRQLLMRSFLFVRFCRLNLKAIHFKLFGSPFLFWDRTLSSQKVETGKILIRKLRVVQGRLFLRWVNVPRNLSFEVSGLLG